MILNDIIKEVKPSREEEKKVSDNISLFLRKLNKGLKEKTILGGSGAKGTWLKGTKEMDVFVCFNYKKYRNKSDELSEYLNKILKKKFKKAERLHGSRDYFRIKQHDFIFEVIPILEIKKAEHALNITDVSPLHATWVNSKLKKRKLADDIRLLKKFCKAQGVYGAESYIGGFSGYVCEILVIYYDGFLNLLKQAAKWKPKVIIDIKKYYKGKNVLKELNFSKLQSPIVVIDPVQKSRNAAAALTNEKFNLFKKAAKEFLKNPSKDFFNEKSINLKELKEKTNGNKLIILEIIPLKGKEDVVGSKILKVYNHVLKKINENNFEIIETGWRWNKKALLYYIIKKEELSEFVEIMGPPIKQKQHVRKFKKAHKNTFVRKSRIYAKVKRKFKEAKSLVKYLIKDSWVKEKVERIRLK